MNDLNTMGYMITGNRKILVVDDKDAIRNMFEQTFGRAGFTVQSAESAEKALEILNGEKIQVMFLDLNMPGMDGLSATRTIRKNLALKYVPVVALSSYVMKADKEKARAAGCTGYITKPIDTRSFLKTVDQYLK